MATVIEKKQQENQEFDPETMFITPTGEIKRLSKYGIWRRQNPGGIMTVVDKEYIKRMRY